MSDTDPEAKTISASLEAAPARVTSPEESPPLLAGRYELRGMLGAGAMGTVYRAFDRELDEVVALKMLKKELASSDMIERFRREVKLARRVTHKNVARTYDIGEDGGERFLTMEFIEGEMLGSLLARRGRLPLDEVVRLALDVCAGLAAAHAADVLHRDLKPENVIVAKDGRAVITDFGIARAAAPGDLSRTVGGIVGTPAYMAPEQVEGATDLDARADLYALGAMLFELLTGQMAWQGDSIVTVAAGRLLRPPPDARSVMPSLPARAAELVLKLMARRREDRFASAEETAAALEDLVAAPSVAAPRPAPSGTLPLLPPLPSLQQQRASGARVVAVLPVLNLGPSDDAYLVENVNEDIVDLLSVVPSLLVRPRGDTARFDDAKRDVREIGRSLGADVVVDGSLRRLGDVLRVSFRLIAVADGFQLWARRFDRPPAQVLSIADDAAHAIAGALTAELGQAAKARSAEPEAEDLFLRGRYLMRRGWLEVVREAVELLARAHARAPDDVRIMSTYALAVARVYGMDAFGRDAAERARALATRATELEPMQPEAKVALALIHLQSQEVDAAVRYFRAALGVAPNSVDALDWLGRVMAEVGRIEEGFALLRKATAIDPELVQARQQIARVRSILGDSAGMREALGDIPPHPGDIGAWFVIQTRDAMWRRDVGEAQRLSAVLSTVTLPDSARFAVEHMLKVPLGEAGLLRDRAFVDRVLPVDASRPPRRASFNAQLRAEMHAFFRMDAETFEALRACDANGLVDVVWLDRCPLFDPLRGEPEFTTIQNRVALRARRVTATLDERSPIGI
ncbi:MAG: protein kinase [Labilithrix sp.]|nr:protein kinase [Labilithrix sp.]